MKDKKFIIIKDKLTADKFIANGVQLVAQANGTYTFMNIIPQHFNFNEIDAKKIAYTDILLI